MRRWSLLRMTVTATAVLLMTAAGLTTSPPVTPAPAAAAEQTSGPAAAQHRSSLPLGHRWLPETRSSRRLAPGVTYTRIERGFRPRWEAFTVDVALTRSWQEAAALRRILRRGGYAAWIEVVQQQPSQTRGLLPRGPFAFIVRAGRFVERADADALAGRLQADGYDASTQYTGEDGDPTTGPWVIHVLEIDPSRFAGTVAPALASGHITSLESVLGIAGRADALAAVNGGFYVFSEEIGTVGDLAGVSMLDGALLSEAVDGRTSLLLSDDTARIAAVETTLVAELPGSARLVDGFNRKPGLIRSCGGDGGDQPTEEPKHDFDCTDDSELIMFTPVFDGATEPGAGAEAIISADGEVTAVSGERGHAIPEGGFVLSATGQDAAWLLDDVSVGDPIDVVAQVYADGRRVDAERELGMVNGGPQLVTHGKRRIADVAEGFAWSPTFFYYFSVHRNPRTLAGTTRDGRLLLVAADGRAPEHSVGLSFRESAAVLQALGAREGVNLDGGGSTQMVIDGEVVNRPSSGPQGRPVGDAVLVLP